LAKPVAGGFCKNSTNENHSASADSGQRQIIDVAEGVAVSGGTAVSCPRDDFRHIWRVRPAGFYAAPGRWRNSNLTMSNSQMSLYMAALRSQLLFVFILPAACRPSVQLRDGMSDFHGVFPYSLPARTVGPRARPCWALIDDLIAAGVTVTRSARPRFATRSRPRHDVERHRAADGRVRWWRRRIARRRPRERAGGHRPPMRSAGSDIPALGADGSSHLEAYFPLRMRVESYFRAIATPSLPVVALHQSAIPATTSRSSDRAARTPAHPLHQGRLDNTGACSRS